MDDPPTITVRVIILGQAIRWIDLPSVTTLGVALELAGVDVAGKDVHINGRPAALDMTLAHHDVVTAIPRVRGGYIRTLRFRILA